MQCSPVRLTLCRVVTSLLILFTWMYMSLRYFSVLSLSRWSCTSRRAIWPAISPAALTNAGTCCTLLSRFSLVSSKVPKNGYWSFCKRKASYFLNPNWCHHGETFRLTLMPNETLSKLLILKVRLGFLTWVNRKEIDGMPEKARNG